MPALNTKGYSPRRFGGTRPNSSESHSEISTRAPFLYCRRLFDRETDNQQEEPLLLQQLAAASLRRWCCGLDAGQPRALAAATLRLRAAVESLRSLQVPGRPALPCNIRREGG